MNPIEKLKEQAKCDNCIREYYCMRIPTNDLIVKEIKKNKKCPDFSPRIILPYP